MDYNFSNLLYKFKDVSKDIRSIINVSDEYNDTNSIEENIKTCFDFFSNLNSESEFKYDKERTDKISNKIVEVCKLYTNDIDINKNIIKKKGLFLVP